MTLTTAAGTQVQVNGTSLYVEEHGQGDPLVLVQPGLLAGGVYAGVAALLGEQYRVITFDNRGHGRSTNPSSEMSYELFAEDTVALIEALKLERPFVGGWSDGGQVALEIGVRYPDLARALIVGAASLELQSDASHEMMRSFFQVNVDGVVDFDEFAAGHGQMMLPMLRRFHPHGEEHWQSVLQRSATMWLAYAGLTREQVATIETPALVIQGDRDDVIPVDEGVKIYRWLPNAELAILPGADHMRPIFDPTVFAHVVSDFLQRH
ncbi:MAG TPA: alpha/beta hydrolase [Thermomicrobiales bacterium]|nr:alpha/beta hydrolase [Thermomicrobiales bacterium]